MSGPLDSGLDFYRAVLDLRGYRQELLTADIANASTPGFKAVDLDFKAALAATLSQSPAAAPANMLLVSDERHFGGAAASERGSSSAMKRAVKYQTGMPVTLDGNSVDLNQEKMIAAENALDYEAAVTFTTQTINMMMTAIKGSSNRQG